MKEQSEALEKLAR